MIEVRNLTKSYIHKGEKITVFKNLSFTIETGESVAILGRNGAGKSSLLRIIGGIDLPDSGEVKTDRSMSWPVGLKGGFQGSLTGRENIIFVSKMFYGNDFEKINETVNFVKDFADIGLYFDKPFKSYSTGMRARLTFGTSMAFKFDVYLIDEVSAAGDVGFREKCKAHLAEKLKNSDFLMVNHNLWSLKPVCNRAFVLDQGKLFQYHNVPEAIQFHKETLGTIISTKGNKKNDSIRNKKRQSKNPRKFINKKSDNFKNKNLVDKGR